MRRSPFGRNERKAARSGGGKGLRRVTRRPARSAGGSETPAKQGMSEIRKILAGRPGAATLSRIAGIGKALLSTFAAISNSVVATSRARDNSIVKSCGALFERAPHLRRPKTNVPSFSYLRSA